MSIPPFYLFLGVKTPQCKIMPLCLLFVHFLYYTTFDYSQCLFLFRFFSLSQILSPNDNLYTELERLGVERIDTLLYSRVE